MSATTGTPSADALASVAFMTGVSAGGTIIVQNSGWGWNPAIAGAPVYDGANWPHKWGGGAAGTPASVTYAFDPGSNFSAGDQAIISAALALWSAESGISFTEVASPAAAQLAFYQYGAPADPITTPGVFTGYTAVSGSAGAATIPATTSVSTSFDTAIPAFASLDSFTAEAGYGVDSVVHEMGHVLGLFHAGPYNDTVNALTQQFDSTDSRQWSVMSYIDPWVPAAYSSEYTYTDTQWGSAPDGQARTPMTPMPLDILAAQRLYGLPTSTPLDGGQVFGFHTNITGAIAPFFDFTVDTTPVVTLWDEGTGNALDLSGFAAAATVDLQPGTFSSADGLTNNIGIAYGTRIDRLVGAQGGGTVTLNADSDTVQATGGVNAAVVAAGQGLYAVGAAGADTVTVLSGAGVRDVLAGVQALSFTGGGDTVAGIGAGAGVATLGVSGGGNQVYVGGGFADVASGGGDTVVGGAGGASVSVATAASLGSLIFGATGALSVTDGGGTDTVVSGTAGAAVRGGAGGALVWAAGPVVYDGGSGAGTVAAGAGGSVTAWGGGGGGLFVGGAAGGNVLGADIGAATLFGAGAGDQLVAANAAADVLVAGAGAETMYAAAATGADTFFAGSATVAITGGAGSNLFVAGAGAATVDAGTGAGLLAAIAGHAGGEILALGWNPARNRLELFGYGGGAVAAAVAGATVQGGSTVVTLADHTRIVFADLRGIGAGWFA